MSAAGNIVELRQLLAERFPHLRQGVVVPPPAGTLPSGVPALDQLLGGGLSRGEFTELIGAGDGSGSAQIIHALLRRVAADGRFLALIDGMDSFDATSVEPDVLTHLLWVRCRGAGEAMKSVDLLLRDRNVPLIVLDLKLNTAAQLRRIPASTWYRHARLLEQNQTTVLIVTPFQLVSGAGCRVRIESRLGIDALSRAPEELLPQLRFTLLRSLRAASDEPAAATG